MADARTAVVLLAKDLGGRDVSYPTHSADLAVVADPPAATKLNVTQRQETP